MQKVIASFILLFLIAQTVFCQNYEIDYSLKNGYTLVHKKSPVTSQYQSAPEKIYGVIDYQNKIVVPIKYKSIFDSGEKGLYVIKDGTDNAGLFSVAEQKEIIEPQYFEIEGFSEGLAVVKKRKPDFGFSWGAVDVTGKIIIPVEYDYLGVLNDGLINFGKDSKMGFLDKDNNVIIPAMYDNFSAFNEGLAPVKVPETGKYGYIDKTNKMVIAAEYEDANPFYGGFASVAKKKGYSISKAGQNSTFVPGEWVLINKTGKVVLEKTFDRISPINTGGLFVIELGGKKGVMNSSGMPILPVEFSDVTVDKNGYIMYKTVDKKYGMMAANGSEILKPKYDYVSQTTAARYYSILNGKYEVGDVNKNILIPADSANGVILGKKRIVYHYNNKVKIFDLNGNLHKTITDLNLKNYGHSLTITEDSIKLNTAATAQLLHLVTNAKKILPFGEAGDFNEEGIFIGKNKGYDFYDYTGKKLNTESYYSVVNFSEGICALQETSTSSPQLADKNFKKIKDLYTYFKGPFSEGLAYATNSNSGTIYYLDKTGNEVFSLSAKEGSKCTEGFITINGNDGRFYHVNKKGKSISARTWEDASEFSEGLALVKDKGKWGFIDTLGKTVIELKYDIGSSFSKGAAIVKLNDKFILINKKGEAINGNKYDGAGNPANGSFPLQKDNQVGLIDSKGNTIIDFKYNSILYMSEDRVWAAKDGKWGLLDNKGKALTEFIYQGAYSFENGFARVVIDDKVGVVNKSGKLIIPAEYKSLGSVYKNSIIGIKPEGVITYSIK